MKPFTTPVAVSIAIAALLSACDRGAVDAPEAAARPNIVFILIDTLRADRIGAVRNGNLVMPFVARLAAQGTYYPNAISPCSWTKPAMASLFTGVHPESHGVTYSARIEDPEHPTSDKLADVWDTLPERLAAAGYATWGFQTNANLTRPLGFAQGFADDCYAFANGAPGADVTRAALAALPDLPEPFFLYAHYMDPHAPYTPAAEVEGALGPMPEIPDAERALVEDGERFMDFLLDQVKTAIGLQPAHTLPDLSEPGKEFVRHRYDLACHAADRAVERLVSRVQAIHPNTIVIVLSDHGEEFWERGGMGHGTTLHQEQIRVPLIIVDPTRPAARHDAMVSSLLLLDVLAERLGLPLAPEPTAGKPILAFTRGPWPELGIHQNALFADGYAFLDNLASGTSAAYYLPADPAEQTDLAPRDPDLAARLRGQLNDVSGAAGASPSAVAPLSPEERAALEAIGYLDKNPGPLP